MPSCRRGDTKSLAPLGKVAPQATDEVPIKPLRTILSRLSHRARNPFIPLGRGRETPEGGIVPIRIFAKQERSHRRMNCDKVSSAPFFSENTPRRVPRLLPKGRLCFHIPWSGLLKIVSSGFMGTSSTARSQARSAVPLPQRGKAFGFTAPAQLYPNM